MTPSNAEKVHGSGKSVLTFDHRFNLNVAALVLSHFEANGPNWLKSPGGVHPSFSVKPSCPNSAKGDRWGEDDRPDQSAAARASRMSLLSANGTLCSFAPGRCVR
jgi:hypothetical protein